ncbi:hypothetical protein BDW22DRAFT_1428215 [Trametopsis cervina]|nr:hypothetical protein BDW22DRAFT_1428215 [Trametopsis cervina]
MPLATAADLPPELFPTILHYLAVDDSGRGRNDNIRHTLAVISLTCRYWADQCRPHLLNSLNLQTKEHLYELSHLLSESAHTLVGVAPLTRHLQTLSIMPAKRSPPWIHLVSTILRPMLPDHIEIYLGLDVSMLESNPGQAVRSIHYSLPMSVPASYSYFHSLYLADVHFKGAADFVHLVSELPVLRRLRCERLTWEPTSPTAAVWHRMKFPAYIQNIDAEDCTNNWPMLGLFARRSVAPVVDDNCLTRPLSQDYELDLNDLHVAGGIVQECQRVSGHPSGNASTSVTIASTWWTSGQGYDLSHTAMGFFDPPYQPPDVLFAVELQKVAAHHRRRSSFSLEPRLSDIVVVAFDLVPSARWCWHPWDCNWTTIATLASQLPHLQCLVLGFVSKSNLKHFARRSTGQALSEFADSRKLRYAYVTGHDRTWIAVDPVTLIDESPPVTYTRLLDVGRAHGEGRRRGSDSSWLTASSQPSHRT